MIVVAFSNTMVMWWISSASLPNFVAEGTGAKKCVGDRCVFKAVYTTLPFNNL